MEDFLYSSVGFIIVWAVIIASIALSIYMSWWTFYGRDISKAKTIKVWDTEVTLILSEDNGKWSVLVIGDRPRKLMKFTFNTRREALKKRRALIRASKRVNKTPL